VAKEVKEKRRNANDKEDEKMIVEMESLMKNYSGTDCEEVSKFYEWLQKSKDTVKRKSPNGFNQMAFDRTAVKFRSWTEEQFNNHIEKLKKTFERSRTMTEEDVKKINDINSKAVEARRVAMMRG